MVKTGRRYAAHAGCLVVSSIYGAATEADVRAHRALQRDVVARYGRIAFLTLVDPEATPRIARDARDEAEALAREFDAQTVALAFVVCGTGDFATMTRDALAGIQQLAQPKAPWHLVADDVPGALAWLADKLAVGGSVFETTAVAAAVGDALSAAGHELPADHLLSAAHAPLLTATAVTPRPQPTPASAAALPATLGRYTLVERLGAGGMAEVFLATVDAPGGFQKELVVKRIHRHLAEDPSFVEMFLHEARVAARLSHTNIVPIFDAGEVDGTPFIAMEYIDGLSAYDAARRFGAAGRKVPVAVVATIVADAARALHYAHSLCLADGKPAPVIHRDISPDNMVIARDGTTKLVDFGIAKSSDGGQATATGVLKGKIPFMSPEQVSGQPLDGRADLYSLGCAFYVLLTHERPFSGGNEVTLIKRILDERPVSPRFLRDDVPASIDAVVCALLEKDAERRIPTGLELAQRIAKAVPLDRDAVAAFVAEALALPQPSRARGASRDGIVNIPPPAALRRTRLGAVAVGIAAAGAVALLALLVWLALG